MLKGIRLTFNDGTTYRAKENVDWEHDIEPLYKLDGRQNLVTIYNEFVNSGGDPNNFNSNFQGAFVGFGAGIHTINVDIYQFKGNGQSWGDADTTDGGDEATTLLHTLLHDILTKASDSKQPLKLEVGEFEDNGKYDAFKVALGKVTLPRGATENQPSNFGGSIQFFDAVDLQQSLSAFHRRG